MKTTKEITLLRIELSEGRLKILDGDRIINDDKWFSVSDVEQLQKELKERLTVIPLKNWDRETIKDSEYMNDKIQPIIDDIFNNFKGK